ncbi:MAG: transposase, partial [Dehalococcoidia bacterium]|nr:transposase [Dehalococcoidia bacterium]
FNGHQSQVKWKDGGVRLRGIPQGRYTREFRQEAVKLVAEDKTSCREAAQRLSLTLSTLAYWLKAY